MKKKITFIIGTPFSGSTLLGNILNMIPDTTFIGEVNRIRSFGQWEGTIENYNNECTICATEPYRECPVWNKEKLKKIDETSSIKNKYEELISDIKQSHIIDGSKSPDWIARVFDSGLEANFQAIICTRNPWAFALSHKGATMNNNGVPAQAFQAAENWRDIYTHALRVLSFRNIPTTIIQYEKLTSSPEKTISPFIHSIERETPKSISDYYKSEIHPIGGNRSAYIKYSEFNIENCIKENPDEREKLEKRRSMNPIPIDESSWMLNLSDEEVANVINTPGILDLASLLGYNLSDYIILRERKRLQGLSAPAP